MPSYHPSVPGPVTRPLSNANASTGNVAGVAAQVTVAGGIGTPGAAIPGNVTGVAANVIVKGGIGTPAGVTSAGVVVNQWAATFAQPATFGNMPPALQSTVIALTPSTSVGGGSGVPSAGNWLFCITGWQAGLSAATVGAADDIRSFWRPGDVTTSTWAVSSPSGHTRTSVWYTPNLARVPGDVYVAPSGGMAGRACLVVEVSGIGPWDTVTGITSAYANSTRSLTLALAAPSSASFRIAAVTGDNSSAAPSTVFNPGGWTPLHTVIATNGTDHSGDAVLTSAYRGSDSSAVNVSASAGTAENLSGVVLSVQLGAPSPIPANQNPNWPYMKVEVALGAGFQTPPDQLTWTDITSRAWSWDESTGTQYQLNQVRASNVSLELDNYDGALSYDNASGPYYGSLNTGNPIRIRAAAGTLGGATFNRWYVIQKNAQEWPQEITDIHRRYAPVTATDIWSVMAASCFTPYRGEVYQDSPYAWWPCDDAPLTAGVQPVSLRNAAPGNTSTLSITAAPGGVSSGDTYTTAGHDATTDSISGISQANGIPPSVATYLAGQQSAWMYGDPTTSATGIATSSPVTANPGSAAWEQVGGAGNAGSNGWFLTCNDASFPGLSGGITFGFWFSCPFFGTATGYYYDGTPTLETLCGQPYSVITLATLMTGSAPCAIIQLDLNGHLNLITYNGTTPTSHSIYSTSDLRASSWQHVMLTTTASAWTVYVNGGLTATVSGSGAGMTSAWTWLAVNADFGSTHGGSSLSSNVHSGNVAYSHIQVYASELPAWRILAHYSAAITAFGLLPAPQAPALTQVGSGARYTGTVGNTFSRTPDGTEYDGTYGYSGSGTTQLVYSVSTVTVAQAGSYHSGPSARVAQGGIGGYDGNHTFGYAVWVGWTGVFPLVAIYTSATADAELNAATACGSGDSFTTGFGSGASGHGVCQTASGTNAAPPASASALGDAAGQRIERILGYGQVTYPGRCIDPASLPVQAATDVGGQAAANNVTNIAQSDGGSLYVDSQNNLTYWQKSHLASQYSSPAWTLGPAASGATVIPYARTLRWTADPQRVWTFIGITPFAPDGSQLAIIEPTNATGVNAAQKQYGAQPLAFSSYLQSTTEMQTQANWLFTNFGTLQIRTEEVQVDAASYPAAWAMVLGASVGDVISIQNWQIGGGGVTGTFRISNIRRRLHFGGQDGQVEGTITLQGDWEPPSYWS